MTPSIFHQPGSFASVVREVSVWTPSAAISAGMPNAARWRAGTDRRELRLSLTAAGQHEYERVVPYWQSAQKRLRQELGEGNWNQVMNAAMHVAEATPKAD